MIIVRCDVEGCERSIDVGSGDGTLLSSMPGWRSLSWVEQDPHGAQLRNDYVVCPDHPIPTMKKEVLETDRPAGSGLRAVRPLAD